MSDPKINSILDEANKLFLKGKLREAITYYDKILSENPKHLSSLNNKGYALSKLKDFENALKCYNKALESFPNDLSVLVNKISSLRKQGFFDEALAYCDKILEKNPNYNITLYHKERILFSLKRFDDSISCCDKILNDYPENADVLYDKSCDLSMLCKETEALEYLEHAISLNSKFKSKAKKAKPFERFSENSRFQKLIS